MSDQEQELKAIRGTAAREAVAGAVLSMKGIGMSDQEIYWTLQGACAVFQAHETIKKERAEQQEGE